MKGTAAPTTPAPPTTAVAAVRKRRRPLFTGISLIHTLQLVFGIKLFFILYVDLCNKGTYSIAFVLV
jgi:hypothetical protein